ncbi:S8 family serine peptidase [Tenacibaculum sp. UWU-22]|uniref:S8 family serine peptidase n=1 Tax=Tenacibaculum sp. UWU-22 TaxID=3234187 RepID=UPI0034DB3C71
MNKNTLLFIGLLVSICSFSQEDAWVFFNNKPNAASYIANPLTMLSQRALDRREKQNIALDDKDVPVDINYYNQIKNATGITVLAKSKWLNALHIQGTESAITNLKSNYSFIKNIEFANKSIAVSAKTTTVAKQQQKFTETITEFNYGNAANQIKMLHGDFLHQQGFTGSGMQIAIIDAGFTNANTLAAFQRLRDNNQILGGYNFVNRSTNFYTGSSHGTHVLSDIGGYIDGQFVGTAPDASFYLFVSEDTSREVPLEESLWVEAAEKADSLGVDVINTSLGYTTFDNANYNYTYSDMDGKTTFISRGAEIGASRGMVLVNSVGNSGNSSWKYVGAPADAENVLAVGAVDASKTIANFSSYGPTVDGRVKPDVLAQGQAAYVIHYQYGTPATANGTSFSSPILAGVVACFWQAFPNKTHTEIVEAIKQSSDKYNTPDAHYGYGIPNFELAKQTLTISNSNNDFTNVVVYPNPATDTIHFKINEDQSNYQLKIFSLLGEQLLSTTNLSKNIAISHLSSGIYLVQIQHKNQHKNILLVKK